MHVLPAPVNVRRNVRASEFAGSPRRAIARARKRATLGWPTQHGAGTDAMGQHVSESTQLLRRWHQGDEGALQELLAHHLPWIRVHVRQRLGEALRAKEETGDIVQDALLEFLRYGPRFEIRNEAHLRFLLARIAENVLRDRNDFYTRRRRQAARETPFTEDGLLVLDGSARPATQPDEALERKQWRAWVRLALELLDPQDRDVIVLRTWDGLEFAEVAQRTELSVDLARVRFHRALPKLAAKIQALQRGEFGAVELDATTVSGD